MKKIGFVDYYIDQWHANNYPQMIRSSRFKDHYDVTLAWEMQHTLPDKQPIDQWCSEQNVRRAESIEQVVDECDAIVVMSPNNAEYHEKLADLPLRSGKPVYIDKPIAPSLAAAKRLFEKAATYNTPMMSSSALRFGSALQNALSDKVKGDRVHFAATRGGGVFHVYAIHQIEMLVMTLGVGAMRVMHCGNDHANVMLVDYDDGRRGSIQLLPGAPFSMAITYGDAHSESLDTMDDFFPRFIDAMLTFFDTGRSPIPVAQTLEIAALIEAGQQGLTQRDQWVPVPR
jgi:predicted dehydrogenase